jgi:hypothetical protein
MIPTLPVSSDSRAIEHKGGAERPPVLSALARVNDNLEIAKIYIRSGLMPKAITRPEQAVIILEMGDALGIPKVFAMQSIFVVNNKPGQQADLMRALVFRAYPDAIFNVLENTDRICVIEAARPGGKVTKFQFTIEQAKRAGLLNKDGWIKYPEAMLLARTTAIVGRVLFADALMGIIYTPEELGADVDDEGNIVAIDKGVLETSETTSTVKKALAIQASELGPIAGQVIIYEEDAQPPTSEPPIQYEEKPGATPYTPIGPDAHTRDQHELLDKLRRSHLIPTVMREKVETAMQQGLSKGMASKAIDNLTKTIGNLSLIEESIKMDFDLPPHVARWMMLHVKDWPMRAINVLIDTNHEGNPFVKWNDGAAQDIDNLHKEWGMEIKPK